MDIEASTSGAHLMNREHMAALGRSFHAEYAAGQPFPHIVIDEFFPEATLDAAISEFPRRDGEQWRQFNHKHSQKLAIGDELLMGEITRQFIYYLNSSVFLAFLEQMTGIEGLLPDPYLFGGGLHQIERGGYLKIHADFNWHKQLKLDRRLNLLIYLNRDWDESYGGHLDLWDENMSRCEKRVLPIFNRMVVFSTTDFSYHGHPDPLTCPPERCRQSLALYYYSNGRPESERSASHNTIYRSRPGTDDPEVTSPNVKSPVKQDAKRSPLARLLRL